MSESDDMTCAELADVAAELALGVLTGRERAMALAHLETCDACREEVRRLMETGGQLVELLPSVEPAAGFETRVLARLGLPAAAREPGQPQSAERRFPALPRGSAGAVNHRRRPSGNFRSPGGARPGGGIQPAGEMRPGGGRPGSSARRPGSPRRMLAAAAIGLVIVVAGLGGWRIGTARPPAAAPTSAGPPPASTAPGSLTSVDLLSATRQSVGTIYLYSGPPRWLYMSVDVQTNSAWVTCQLIGADGKAHTLGSFALTDGYGDWGSPDPGDIGDVRGARLVAASGAVVATATFTHW